MLPFFVNFVSSWYKNTYKMSIFEKLRDIGLCDCRAVEVGLRLKNGFILWGIYWLPGWG
jgi:hypothetical protein